MGDKKGGFIQRGAPARRDAFSLQTDLIPDSFQSTSTDATDDQQFLHPSKRRILLSILQNALRGRFTNSRQRLQFFERCLVDVDSLRRTTLCARDVGCLRCGRRLAGGTLPGQDGEKQSQRKQGIPDHWLMCKTSGRVRSLISPLPGRVSARESFGGCPKIHSTPRRTPESHTRESRSKSEETRRDALAL